MPRNPNKRRCAVPGCRAWAMRGSHVCGSHRNESPAPSGGAGWGEGGAPTLTADYTLDDLAAHAAMALNRLQAWYGAREDDPRWVIAYVRQLYQCLARLAELWKQRATMGPDQLNGALNHALAELRQDIGEQ
jgi:hypothetical protein